MKASKLILVFILIFMASACDTIDEVKKLKEDIKYYKGLYIDANQKLNDANKKIHELNITLENVMSELEKAKLEIKHSKELHKRMME